MRGSCWTATHFGWLFTTQWYTTYMDVMRLVKVFCSCHQWCFAQLGHRAFHIFGPSKRTKKGPNWEFSQLKLYVITLLMKTIRKRLKRHWGHPDWKVWPICKIQNVTNMASRNPKNGQKICKWTFVHTKTLKHLYTKTLKFIFWTCINIMFDVLQTASLINWFTGAVPT